MEAFGLVQLEAMACGKPVVCTQLGNGVNLVNVHGETGLAVPVGDPVVLGATLERLLQDTALRARLGQQALVHARDRYSLEAMTTAHLKLYRSLLS
jgi:rhamnosyl/mannosyltransferase